ncbi:MAG: ADP-L-glycero-D-mannoheptose-6-epimerase, partial [Gemmatimonadaceae bacterium]|nr:ADP-L-glycero-D-mannoheptose-6-epimerase [Gemmatimonadaceae bacterium]
NLGTGKARTFLDLARAVCKAAGHDEAISFIDTPPSIREQYQYFTEAKMDRLRALGYSKEFRSLESGVTEYVKRLSA